MDEFYKINERLEMTSITRTRKVERPGANVSRRLPIIRHFQVLGVSNGPASTAVQVG